MKIIGAFIWAVSDPDKVRYNVFSPLFASEVKVTRLKIAIGILIPFIVSLVGAFYSIKLHPTAPSFFAGAMTLFSFIQFSVARVVRNANMRRYFYLRSFGYLTGVFGLLYLLK